MGGFEKGRHEGRESEGRGRRWFLIIGGWWERKSRKG